MENRARHLLHDTGWRWSLPDQIDDPCNAAHSITIAEERIEESREMNSQRIGLVSLAHKKIGKRRVLRAANE
jgi:hypothetical protein